MGRTNSGWQQGASLLCLQLLIHQTWKAKSPEGSIHQYDTTIATIGSRKAISKYTLPTKWEIRAQPTPAREINIERFTLRSSRPSQQCWLSCSLILFSSQSNTTVQQRAAHNTCQEHCFYNLYSLKSDPFHWGQVTGWKLR